MQWTGLNELREKFLSFFEEKAHLRLESFSLVPKDDNSLLLINSGMAPMKKYFLGEVTPPSKRVTTCQKCVRTPDIERVGITARHGTFFEMLGNFSFGDYFKKEAIAWAWEFFTEVLEMPVDKLYPSVFFEDDEAYDIWINEIGVAPSHVVKLGREDNFWEHGAGPCGPSSEIYFDRGEKHGCSEADCKVGCECDRFVEVWNLVFTQFISDGNGNYERIKHPNIDTGMGMERLACVMQDVDNLFLIDTNLQILKKVEEISALKYGEDDNRDISIRVITDHIRSAVFLISDGVLPSNEGRGYVLRRLIRRAARHGKILGVKSRFLSDLADSVIEVSGGAYSELIERRDMIKNVIMHEEISFNKTIDQGLAHLSSFIDKLSTKFFPGEQAFLLNDTYGFPLDLTKEILAERGVTVDEDKFTALMREQKERARNARKSMSADAWTDDDGITADLSETEFLGYDGLTCNAKILAIIKDGEKVSLANTGDKVTIILDKTTFYAESGGQVGDFGVLKAEVGLAEITNTTKNSVSVYSHRAVVTEGKLEVGAEVMPEVGESNRRSIMRNHTAAHLLQAALKNVLGAHVEQAGQLVDGDRVRFDFTHFSAMTAKEIEKTEALVNREILSAVDVIVKELPVDEAKKMGATALFGEKYGDVVRVVSIENFSSEFCGGTHVSNTSKLGLFKIVSESSVASGVRRIEAVTGSGVLGLIKNHDELISNSAQALKVPNIADLPAKSQQIMEELREKDRLIEALHSKLAAVNMDSLFANAVEIDGVKIISAVLAGTGSDALRAMCDKVRDSAEPIVAVIGGSTDGKLTFAATATKAAQEMGIKAGKLVSDVAAITGGKGGGRPDFAMAGAKDLTKADEAIKAVPNLVREQIK